MSRAAEPFRASASDLICDMACLLAVASVNVGARAKGAPPTTTDRSLRNSCRGSQSTSYRAEVEPATALAGRTVAAPLDPDPRHEVGGAELEDAGVVDGTASDGVDDLEAARSGCRSGRARPSRPMPRCVQPFSVGVADRREARAHQGFGRHRPWVLVHVLSQCARSLSVRLRRARRCRQAWGPPSCAGTASRARQRSRLRRP